MTDNMRVMEMKALLVEAESLRAQFEGAPFLEQTIQELQRDIVDIAQMESEIIAKKAWLADHCTQGPS